jgi:hypothetical protein
VAGFESTTTGRFSTDRRQAEGGHFLTTNCGYQGCPPGAAADAADNYIIEADINMMKVRDQAPSGNAFGLILFGASEIAPKGLFQAIHIDSPGVFQRPIVPWKQGIYCSDGAATVGIDLGSQLLAPGSPSQPIALHATTSDGKRQETTVQAASNGDLVLSPGPGRSMVVNGSSILIAKQETPKSSNAPCATGQVEWDSEYIYLCVAKDTWHRIRHESW